MIKIMRRILQDLVFPPYCPGCGRLLNFCDDWCKKCLDEVCAFEKQNTSEFKYLDSAFTLGKYEAGLRKVIHDIKFNGYKSAKIKLTPFLLLLKKQDVFKEIDLIIPIPISSKTRKKRHYNQVDIIFKEFIEKENYKWLDILGKIDDTKPMFKLNKEERMSNINDAFYFKKANGKNLVKGKNILLLDDIFTTGSTMEVVAKLLKNGGAKKITALTLASGAV